MDTEIREKPKIQTLDDLFGIASNPMAGISNDLEITEVIVLMPLEKIKDFSNHPYRVQNDVITQNIVNDILEKKRIETPAIVRPIPDSDDKYKYEMVSGHRRKLACTLAGLSNIPVIIREMSDDEAIISMVNSNNQREEVLPSEKAFAYKMYLDALKKQGKRTDLTSTPLVEKLSKSSAEILGEQNGISREQIRRYIRLTYLITDLLKMVDDSKLPFRTAVELSYLTIEQQKSLLDTIKYDGIPTLNQSSKMKQSSQEGKLNSDVDILSIMAEEEQEQPEQIKIPRKHIDKFFPSGTSTRKIQEVIIKALELYIKRERDNKER